MAFHSLSEESGSIALGLAFIAIIIAIILPFAVAQHPIIVQRQLMLLSGQTSVPSPFLSYGKTFNNVPSINCILITDPLALNEGGTPTIIGEPWLSFSNTTMFTFTISQNGVDVVNRHYTTRCTILANPN